MTTSEREREGFQPSANKKFASKGFDIRTAVKDDHFMMFSYKVETCTKTDSHSWSDCPYAHVGEQNTRRDARVHRYMAVACPFMKKTNYCPMGKNCNMAHNVYECGLHPSRYRTQLCLLGERCTRPVCFFAHSADELRVPTHTPATSDLQSVTGRAQMLATTPTPGQTPVSDMPIEAPQKYLFYQVPANGSGYMSAEAAGLQLSRQFHDLLRAQQAMNMGHAQQLSGTGARYIVNPGERSGVQVLVVDSSSPLLASNDNASYMRPVQVSLAPTMDDCSMMPSVRDSLVQQYLQLQQGVSSPMIHEVQPMMEAPKNMYSQNVPWNVVNDASYQQLVVPDVTPSVGWVLG